VAPFLPLAVPALLLVVPVLLVGVLALHLVVPAELQATGQAKLNFLLRVLLRPLPPAPKVDSLGPQDTRVIPPMLSSGAREEKLRWRWQVEQVSP
jgi:hypothetical protein